MKEDASVQPELAPPMHPNCHICGAFGPLPAPNGFPHGDRMNLPGYSAASAALAASISAAFFSTCSTMCSIIWSFDSLWLCLPAR